MPKPTRERMIDGALMLLAEKGLQRASFHEVTQATGTPRGSIYYHFPGGKSEMVSEALARDLVLVTEVVNGIEASDARSFTDKFITHWVDFMERHNYALSSASVAVAIAAEDEKQQVAARTTMLGFVDVIRQRYIEFGMDAAEALQRARAVVGACQGGVLLARVEGTSDGLEAVRNVLLAGLDS